MIIRPARSMTGATSERAGMCPPGKMYFHVHALVIDRAIDAANRMDESDALSAQQVNNLLEECCIVSGADMFEHAD